MKTEINYCKSRIFKEYWRKTLLCKNNYDECYIV